MEGARSLPATGCVPDWPCGIQANKKGRVKGFLFFLRKRNWILHHFLTQQASWPRTHVFPLQSGVQSRCPDSPKGALHLWQRGLSFLSQWSGLGGQRLIPLGAPASAPVLPLPLIGHPSCSDWRKELCSLGATKAAF